MRAKEVLVLNVLVLAVAVSSGCRSFGWKPGSMFSSNRKPSDSEFADARIPEPESPASKYTPGTIASVGAGNKTPASTVGTGGESAYGYTTPTTPLGAGLAAKANGYQTGPYQMGSAGGSQTKTPSASTIAKTPQTQGLPNPYGGTYKGAGTPASASTPVGTPDIKLPSTVTDAIAKAKTASGYPTATLPTSPTKPQNSVPVSYPTGATPGSANTGMPSYPSLPTGQIPQGSAGTVGPPPTSAYQPRVQPTTTTNGLPTGSTQLPNAGTASLPNAGSMSLPLPGSAGAPGGLPKLPSMTGSANSAPTTTPAATSESRSEGFAPGTTGRTTGYDFSSTNSGANPLLR